MLVKNTSIPIFPLNVVLFPGMMLPLHIFETRYKAMTQECLDTGAPFGVVLARSKGAVQVGGNSYFDEIYPVGTTAHITAVEHLDNGRMNVIAIGQDRFIIRDVKADLHDLLIGHVDPLPMQPGNPQEVTYLTQKLRPKVEQYIQLLAAASGEDLSDATLPNDPTALAFLAGTAIQGPLAEKQKLLATQSLSTLMANTAHLLDREDKILSYMLRAYEVHQEAQKLPFVDYSLN
jgi:Lon protease-like protein